LWAEKKNSKSRHSYGLLNSGNVRPPDDGDVLTGVRGMVVTKGKKGLFGIYREKGVTDGVWEQMRSPLKKKNLASPEKNKKKVNGGSPSNGDNTGGNKRCCRKTQPEFNIVQVRKQAGRSRVMLISPKRAVRMAGDRAGAWGGKRTVDLEEGGQKNEKRDSHGRQENWHLEVFGQASGKGRVVV